MPIYWTSIPNWFLFPKVQKNKEQSQQNYFVFHTEAHAIKNGLKTRETKVPDMRFWETVLNINPTHKRHSRHMTNG
jgi:hypothetical protein